MSLLKSLLYDDATEGVTDEEIADSLDEFIGDVYDPTGEFDES